MTLRALNLLTVPALALAAALAAAPFAHADGAYCIGSALTPAPMAMAPATVLAPTPGTAPPMAPAAATTPAPALAAAGAPGGMVQIPGLSRRRGCEGGHEFEGREHRFRHEGEDGSRAFRRED